VHYFAQNGLNVAPLFVYIFAHGSFVVQHETNTSKIKRRLEAEGWENFGGGRHDKFKKAGHSSVMVPRHRTVTPGVAESIAKAAGWTK
jgi:predicted RNA binding protein YcfA (HicA-like mRNA interferase family)